MHVLSCLVLSCPVLSCPVQSDERRATNDERRTTSNEQRATRAKRWTMGGDPPSWVEVNEWVVNWKLVGEWLRC
ncbi:hypothetical protein K504DRAFT_239521 [Pleomassaria siparia CBS 279.74]|uniref:Secreted protein n=1 Tax=Pleomassaria siparia CBS 279.74 TaxID=1314801 RepID=A0A6G1KDV7_9PLEO|nr:hypothetical protein K504DRAFT_239521 [Pleomassaria siparia CBS 279.74]